MKKKIVIELTFLPSPLKGYLQKLPTYIYNLKARTNFNDCRFILYVLALFLYWMLKTN